MPYPFSQEILFAEGRQKTLAKLAESTDNVRDKEFPSRLPQMGAPDLDGFARGPLKKYTWQTLPSSDTLVVDKEGFHWFVEFKNQPANNIEGQEIHGKVFGSLLLANLTCSQCMTLRELMSKSIFVVVFPHRDYSTMLGKALAQDAYGPKAVLWGLDKLVKAEMLHDAHTVTDLEFRQLGPFKGEEQP